MILEFDAGNTRIKWRLMREGRDGSLVKGLEGSVLAKKRTPSVFIDLGLQLAALPLTDISRVKVSSVRDEAFKEIFSPWMFEKWQLQPEYAEVSDSCCGVTNSYEDAGSMGVDRWLAMLAAYGDAQGGCCVVDCGTAITLDLLDSSGKHQGGYIVPGIYLMQEALGRNARVLAADTKDVHWQSNKVSTELGMNTKDAVSNGIVSMALGLIERIHTQLDDSASPVNWYVTGGDAEVISALLGWEHKVIPDLVMDGLALAMK